MRCDEEGPEKTVAFLAADGFRMTLQSVNGESR